MKVQHVLATILISQSAIGLAQAHGHGHRADSQESGYREDSFEIAPRLGTTTLSLDAPALKSAAPVEEDAFQAGVDLRYVNAFGPMIEGGYQSQRTHNWDDHDNALRLSQYQLAVGWQFNTAHGFRVTPKVGRARWDLYSPDGLLTQTPVGSNTRRGYDNFWELSLQKEITHNVALGVSFKDNSYEFGNVRSVAFTASFGL